MYKRPIMIACFLKVGPRKTSRFSLLKIVPTCLDLDELSARIAYLIINNAIKQKNTATFINLFFLSYRLTVVSLQNEMSENVTQAFFFLQDAKQINLKK